MKRWIPVILALIVPVVMAAALIVPVVMATSAFSAGCTPPRCRKIMSNGRTSSKKNLVIMGDGFAVGDAGGVATNR